MHQITPDDSDFLRLALLFQPLELAARLNRKEIFYHIIFKNREICWQYGARINYNLDMRVVDGAWADFLILAYANSGHLSSGKSARLPSLPSEVKGV